MPPLNACFASPRTWTVSCSSLLWGCSWAVAQSSVRYLLRSFCSFCHFDWHNVLCSMLQNAVADNWCLCLLHSSVHTVSPLSILKFRNCTVQFRNRIPLSKLVCNFTISNLQSTILKLGKFANSAEHIHTLLSREVLATELSWWEVKTFDNKSHKIVYFISFFVCIINTNQMVLLWTAVSCFGDCSLCTVWLEISAELQFGSFVRNEPKLFLVDFSLAVWRMTVNQ